MTRFETELKKGNFVCSECKKCNQLVWPPSEFCSKCFQSVTWRQITPDAKLVEFSKKGDQIFCIAEFEDDIRVIGTFDTKHYDLKIGQSLLLTECGFNGSERFVFKIKTR